MSDRATTQGGRTWASRPIIALLLLAQFLLLLVLTQSESLHRALHPDAATPNHHCALTLLQSGQLDAPGGDTVVLRPPATPVARAVIALLPVLSVDRFLPPSCGPPALRA